MKKNERRKVAGSVFDRVGRIIDGVIDNGRLILMIALVVSFAFMVGELEELAASNAQGSEARTAVSEPAPSNTAPDDAAGTRIQHRSDYRIRLHRLCADEDYRRQNADRCEQLFREVDEAVRDSVVDEIRRDESGHDGDQGLAPVILAEQARQS